MSSPRQINFTHAVKLAAGSFSSTSTFYTEHNGQWQSGRLSTAHCDLQRPWVNRLALSKIHFMFNSAVTSSTLQRRTARETI